MGHGDDALDTITLKISVVVPQRRLHSRWALRCPEAKRGGGGGVGSTEADDGTRMSIKTKLIRGSGEKNTQKQETARIEKQQARDEVKQNKH